MARVLAAYELHGPLLHQAVATTEPDTPERTAAIAVSRGMLERAQDAPNTLLYDVERLAAGDQRDRRKPWEPRPQVTGHELPELLRAESAPVA